MTTTITQTLTLAQLREDLERLASHDPHDLASAILSTMAAGGTIHTAFPRLCAACGAEIPATEHPDTNLCGRCAQ